MSNPETQQQSVPKLESPMVQQPQGNVNLPWYRFFTYVWEIATGNGQALPGQSVLLQQTPTPGVLVVTDLDGVLLGHITLGP